MKLFFILFFALFSNSSYTETVKNSDDNFINLTNEVKDNQKKGTILTVDNIPHEKNMFWN